LVKNCQLCVFLKNGLGVAQWESACLTWVRTSKTTKQTNKKSITKKKINAMILVNTKLGTITTGIRTTATNSCCGGREIRLTSENSIGKWEFIAKG
jgi:hypothetical protein